MVLIHSARTLAEAELVRETLASAGHEVVMRGMARTGLAGEIPIPDAVVDIWVEEEDATSARAVLAAVEARAHLEWVCGGCGERNPASFEHCWKCQTPVR